MGHRPPGKDLAPLSRGKSPISPWRAIVSAITHLSRSGRPLNQELSPADVHRRIIESWGGPDGLHAEFTDEGIIAILGLPAKFQMRTLRALGLIHRNGFGHYAFTSIVQEPSGSRSGGSMLTPRGNAYGGLREAGERTALGP
jgi:hypothetical protein